jgi:phosphatidylserine/phosphatidylglycerophosphate/cardiolipin synthase-like enzyme
VNRFLSLLVLLGLSVGLIVALRSEQVADLFDRVTGDTGRTDYIGSDMPESGSRQLIALPEDGADAILDELRAATRSIELYVYLLPSDEVLEALTEAHFRGVRVRVILEQDPFGGGNSNQEAFDRLDGIGIDVRWAPDEFTFSHIKSFVVDNQVAVIMTLNLSYTALTTNREFAVLTTVPSDVAEVARLFEADWSGDEYSPAAPIVTSPENSRAVMGELIESADSSIWIYAEVVRDREIRSKLAEAARDGIEVRLLVPTSPADDDLLIYRELVAAGADVSYLRGAYSHAKAILVDGERFLVGSQNLTMTSLGENRELGIVLREPTPIARLISIFESDWAISEPVS